MPPWLLPQPDYMASLPAQCEPTTRLTHLISSYLQICLPTPLALLSSTLGTLSIASWLFAQLPQIFKNYSLQSTSGLSIYFLIEWCLGDSTNLLGALLTRQAGWQVVVAGYYVCVDVVLVSQYFWYSHIKPRRRRDKETEWQYGWQDGHGHGRDGSRYGHIDDILDGLPPADYDSERPSLDIDRQDIEDKRMMIRDSPSTQSAASSVPREKPMTRPVRTIQHGSSSPMPSPKTMLFISLLCALASAHPSPNSSSPRTAKPVSPDYAETAGRILSWSSTLLYLASRLPQIYKNHVRRSTAGLSAKLFIAAFFGNFFYSTSLLTNPFAWNDFPPYGGGGWAGPEGSVRWEWVGRAAPFWLGAAGVLGLDAAIGVQFLMFGEEKGAGKDKAVVVVDERTGRWTRVQGWMRGWVPSPRRGMSPSPEGQRLVGGRVEGGVYGTI